KKYGTRGFTRVPSDWSLTSYVSRGSDHRALEVIPRRLSRVLPVVVPVPVGPVIASERHGDLELVEPTVVHIAPIRTGGSIGVRVVEVGVTRLPERVITLGRQRPPVGG